MNVACHESSFLKSFSHDKQQNFYSTLFLIYISSLGMTPKKHLEFPDYVAGHATLRKQEYYEKQGDLACLLRLLLWDLLGYVLFFSLHCIAMTSMFFILFWVISQLRRKDADGLLRMQGPLNFINQRHQRWSIPSLVLLPKKEHSADFRDFLAWKRNSNLTLLCFLDDDQGFAPKKVRVCSFGVSS